MKRFVVIDGNHLIHRAFYAIQAPLKTSSGEQTNAIYGFASMLFNIMEAEKPDFIAMTFDLKGPTFRHELHEDYKGTRQKAPDELYAQIPRIHEMIDRFKMPVFAQEGYEADDMIGTLAKKAHEEGVEVCIVTGDMDALQLVNGGVRVVFPHKGYREPIVYNAEKVKEKYGIYPDQVADYKALMGDSSDNIKGVEGIGPKRASELLSKYGTLEGIYEHLSEIPGAVRQKLEVGHDNAYFSKKLATIVCDAPCEFSLEGVSMDCLDYLGMGRFLEEMEIRNLSNRLKKLTPEDRRQPEGQMTMF